MDSYMIEPDLIDSFIHKSVRKILTRKQEPTFWEKTWDWTKYIYMEYIVPYKYPIIIILIVGIFLFYRYRMTLKEKQKTKRKKKILYKKFYKKPMRPVGVANRNIASPAMYPVYQSSNSSHNSNHNHIHGHTQNVPISMQNPNQLNTQNLILPYQVQSFNSENYSFADRQFNPLQIPVSLDDFYTMPHVGLIEAPYAK